LFGDKSRPIIRAATRGRSAAILEDAMKLKYLLAATLAFAVSAPAMAADEQPEADKKEKLICRTELATGSRVRKTRLCLTEAQWAELHTKTKKGIDEHNRNYGGETGSGSGANNTAGL
jgi:hypothetical protein